MYLLSSDLEPLDFSQWSHSVACHIMWLICAAPWQAAQFVSFWLALVWFGLASRLTTTFTNFCQRSRFLLQNQVRDSHSLSLSQWTGHFQPATCHLGHVRLTVKVKPRGKSERNRRRPTSRSNNKSPRSVSASLSFWGPGDAAHTYLGNLWRKVGGPQPQATVFFLMSTVFSIFLGVECQS